MLSLKSSLRQLGLFEFERAARQRPAILRRKPHFACIDLPRPERFCVALCSRDELLPSTTAQDFRNQQPFFAQARSTPGKFIRENGPAN